MNRSALHTMTTPQLVEHFVDITKDQYEALLDDDLNRFRQLFSAMRFVLDELKSRPGDQRTALIPLYRHPNPQVRLKAAKNTLAVAHDEALKVIQDIAKSNSFPQSGEAGMSLRNLEDGIFKPT